VPLETFEERFREHVTPSLPFVLYLFFEQIGLALLAFGGLLVFFGWLRWRWRRERAMASLETGSPILNRQALAADPRRDAGDAPSDAP